MKKEWLIAGVIAGCIAGAGVGACSSGGTGGSGVGASGAGASSTTGTPSSTTGTPAATTGSLSSTTGSSTTTTTSGGGSSSATTTTTTSGGGSTTTTTSGTGGECGKVTMIYPVDYDAGPNTLYCPFSKPDGGKTSYCDPQQGQHCCETPEGSTTPSACVDGLTTSCPVAGSVDWQCADPVADCPSGMDCCATPAGVTFVTAPAGCGNYTKGKMTGTACVAAGSCTTITLCTVDSECPAAHPTCTQFEKGGNGVGGCQ